MCVLICQVAGWQGRMVAGWQIMAGYEDSTLYKVSKQMDVEIHRLTLDKLPKFEMYKQVTVQPLLSYDVA